MKGAVNFELTFNREYHPKETVLGYGEYVKITSPVTHIYSKWYHRLLYYITFKKRFAERYKYKVKIL